MSKSLSLDCYGNLCPIGNISSKLQLYLFTGDNLSAPKSNGVDLDLMVPDQCTGFDLSEKALNYVPKFNFTKAGKLVFSNVVYDCDQSETKDLFQIGMVVNSKLHALTKRHVMKILNFHILADKFSYKAWIHAGKFDTKGVLKAGSAFSKDRVDSFAKGLFLWKPLTYAENGIPTSGAWYKVSVMGKLFEIFNSTASDVSNLLCDYCVIFYKGVSFLWRQEPLTSPFAHFEKPSLSCPVSLEEISVTHVDKSLVPPLNKKKSRIERLLTPKNSPSEHVLTYSDLNDTQVLSGRPWFFSGCGHVFSYFQGELPHSDTFTSCCLCREKGSLVPLTIPPKMKSNTGLWNISAFDTCGHAIHKDEVELWTCIIEIPVWSNRSYPKLQPKTCINSKTLFYHCCPYCGCQINTAKKLFFL